MLGPLAFSPGVEAQTVPLPVPSVGVPAIPAVPAIPKPTLTPSPVPSPTPTFPIPTLPIPAPVQTIIERVPVPGPVRTIVRTTPSPRNVPVPGPTRTVLVPGPVRTVLVPGPVRTVIRERVVIRQVPGPRVTVEASPKVTPSPVVIFRDRPGDDVDLSTPEAIGISIGLVALGILLALLALYLVYFLGYKERERVEEMKLSDLTDELFGR